MPRVKTQTKSARGAERRCGRCARVIEPGERYHQWSFRYGGTRFACTDHFPRSSELTQSKMSEAYAALENLDDSLPGAESAEELRDLFSEAAEAIRGVAEEYREAAEAMGSAGGELEEKADEVEAAADEVDNFYPDEDQPLADLKEEAASVIASVSL